MAMNKARERLASEINVVQIIKSWRYMERALKVLLPAKTRLELKEKSRYIIVDPD